MSKEKIVRRVLETAESLKQSVIITVNGSRHVIKYHEGILPYKVNNHKLYVCDRLSSEWNSYSIDLISGIEIVLL